MVALLLTAASLFSYGSALIEAGERARGEGLLEGLLSERISLEMEQRLLYNLGLSALKGGEPLKALSRFQAIEGAGAPLQRALQKRVEEALALRDPPPLKPLSPLPSQLSLSPLLEELSLLLQHLAALPFEGGERSHAYTLLGERLQELYRRRGEWWQSFRELQGERLRGGCSLPLFEEAAALLGEGTEELRRASLTFEAGGKPLGQIYPLLERALLSLLKSKKVLNQEAEEASESIWRGQGERVQKLSEMFQRERRAPRTKAHGEALP